MRNTLSITRTSANNEQYITLTLSTEETGTIKIKLSLANYALLTTGMVLELDSESFTSYGGTDKGRKSKAV